MPALRRELEAIRPKSTAAANAPPGLDPNVQLRSMKRKLKIQEARIGKAEAGRESQTTDNRRQARAEYKRLREDIRKEEAEPERDEAFISMLTAADALESIEEGNSAPDA